MSEDGPAERVWCIFLSTLMFSMILGFQHVSGSGFSNEHRSEPQKPSRRLTSHSRHSDYNGWSEWSACSRSCGAGISTRSRICKQRYGSSTSYFRCAGDSKQFRLCSTQICPDSEIDFRQYQCSAYNNREIAGEMTKKWIPVPGHYDCDLKCKSTHHKSIYTFGKAADGTKCNALKNNVCINGRCLPVGCDLIIGSIKSVDECGICGGSSESCSFVSDVFFEQRSRTGTSEYQEVAFIPAGASRIRVEENSGNNHLALMNSHRRFVVNGGRTLGWPGSYTVAGTTVNYSRSGNDESFSIMGPTQENIYIMVLMYERNNGIRFQYWLPKNRLPSRADNRSINSVENRIDDDRYNTRRNETPRKHHPHEPRRQPRPRPRPQPQEPENNQIPVEYPETPITKTDPRISNKHNQTYWSYDTSSKDNPLIHFGTSTKTSGSTPPSINITPQNYHPDRETKKKRKHRKNKGTCGSCERVNSRIKHFCNSEFVIRAKVLDVKHLGSETRYALEVIESYKNTVNLLVREFVWANDPCRCPKLRRETEYILMGRHDNDYRRNETRLLLERTSFTRKFNPKRDLEMRKLSHARNIKCRRNY